MTDEYPTPPPETPPPTQPTTIVMAPDWAAQLMTAAQEATRLAELNHAALQQLGVRQQKASAVWERTQQVLALYVIMMTVGVCAWVIVHNPEKSDSPLLFVTSLASLIAGFYFGRTNVGTGTVGSLPPKATATNGNGGHH